MRDAGYKNIETLKTSLPEAELIEKIKDVHFIGIRSRTQLNAQVLASANKLPRFIAVSGVKVPKALLRFAAKNSAL